MAGAILVLAHERNIEFPDGLSLLLASAVPEGKGVSSSAAVEVAAMSAIAALHGLALSGRELALLCQKASEGWDRWEQALEAGRHRSCFLLRGIYNQ